MHAWARSIGPVGVILISGCLSQFDPLRGTADAGAVTSDGSQIQSIPDAQPGAPAPDAVTASGLTLDVSFTTTENGGNYAPRNIVAVWVQDSGGAFVKTLGRWAGTRKNHLVAWRDASGSDADAVSGATRPSHAGTLAITWDLTDRLGGVVPDGTYTIRMELADSNASQPAQNHQGTFTFVKGPAPSSQAVAGGGFLDVAIDYSGR